MNFRRDSFAEVFPPLNFSHLFHERTKNSFLLLALFTYFYSYSVVEFIGYNKIGQLVAIHEGIERELKNYYLFVSFDICYLGKLFFQLDNMISCFPSFRLLPLHGHVDTKQP